MFIWPDAFDPLDGIGHDRLGFGVGDRRVPTEEDLSANLGPKTNRVCWGLLAISTVFMGLRLYCKIHIIKHMWWDDWVMIVAWMMSAVNTGLLTRLSSLGFGKHIYTIPPENLPRLGITGNISSTFSILAVLWSKTSFEVTLLRITRGWTKAFIWFAIVSINLALILTAIFLWVSCKPMAKTYNPGLPGECWNKDILYHYNLFSGYYSAAIDFTLALLPWVVILKLQMKLAEKIGVAVCMSMGFFAGATAIMKTVKLKSLASGDFTWYRCSLILWSAAEASATICAASIPVLRVMLKGIGSSAKKYYRSSMGSRNLLRNSHGESTRMSKTVAGGDTRIVTVDSRPEMTQQDPNDSSEQGMNKRTSGGIVRTDAVEVEYHRRMTGRSSRADTRDPEAQN